MASKQLKPGISKSAGASPAHTANPQALNLEALQESVKEFLKESVKLQTAIMEEKLKEIAEEIVVRNKEIREDIVSAFQVNSILFDMLYSEDNTDNEQEDLPYDGDLQHRGQCSCDSPNLEEFISVEHVSPTVSTLTSSISSLSKENSDCKKQLSQRKVNMVLSTKKNEVEFTMTTGKKIQVGGFTSSGRNEEFSNSKMSDVLLRHFPTEDLTYQLIDSETIPEISFTDSFDETVLIKNKSSENTGIFSPEEEIKNSERKVSCNSVVKNWDVTQDKLSLTDEDAFVCNSKYCNMDDSQFLIQKETGRLNEDLNYTSTHKEYQNQQYFLGNSENFHNPQCNEHQYYKLCDSSEISPKVKELKRNNESFVFKRTKSSTNLLGKDFLEEITFLESDTIRNQADENGTFELDQQLEVLTRQAEVQNNIDHLRFSSKIPPCSNSHTAELSIEARSTGIASKMSAFSPATIPMEHMFDFSQASHPGTLNRLYKKAGCCLEKIFQSFYLIFLKFCLVESNITSSLPLVDAIRQPSVNTPFLQNITDDTEQILKKQTEELKANVEIFSECIKQNVFSVQEHLQFLQLLKEQLEQLEHNYVATKEKHYALQLQNQKHSSRTVGKFDPNRKVEGEIFKLGMFLEDIKEKIEKTFASYSSTSSISPSLRSYPSPICSSYSASPLITSTNESPKRNVAALNIPQNENYWKNKNHPIEGTPQKAYKKSIQGDSNHPFQQIHLELQKKNIHLKTMSSVSKARQQTNKHILIEEFDQCHRSHQTKQNYNNEQENTDRNKTTEYRKATRGHSDCERFPIFFAGKPVDLDVTGSLRKNSIAHQRICKEQREDFIDRLCDRQNLYIPQTRYSKMHDIIILSPQYLSGSNINGRKSVSNRRKRQSKDIKSMVRQDHYLQKQYCLVVDEKFEKCTGYGSSMICWISPPPPLSQHYMCLYMAALAILNCTLDNAIQMANNLKTTTEHMMQAVSEDLAKVKIQTLSSGTAHQY
ncbi:protein AKNAD1 [Ahaetulla prasina]|uniref:protein AKNAD1 n=1 Tax=Ahaetulla prasina TaxID=499056 RepID=UPI002649E7C4|nr:protein AKNAD1 [Ahaetulla prasina]